MANNDSHASTQSAQTDPLAADKAEAALEMAARLKANGGHENHQAHLYTDNYFGPGHWLLKIGQTVVALLVWIVAIVPIIIAILVFRARTIHIFGYAVHLQFGWLMQHQLGEILLFCFGATGVFTIAMALIQNRKRARLVEQWPTYDPLTLKNKIDRQERFMTERFGDENWRTHVREFNVQPDQNLDIDTLQRVAEGKPLTAKEKAGQHRLPRTNQKRGDKQ